MPLRRHSTGPRSRGASLLFGALLLTFVVTTGASSHGEATGQADAPAQTAGSGVSDALTRGPANPILRNDSPFDDLKAGPSSVVKMAAGDYRQWYEALDAENSPGPSDVLSQVAYAVSADGTSWTKKGIVLSPLAAPSWERSEACPTSMHWDGSKWILFYHGGNNSGPRAIGRATSPTGTGAFTRTGPPVLQRGPAGSWDGLFVADAKVIPPWEGPDGLWRMYYVGRSASGVGQVGLATSTDGISFTKVGSAPVVGLGPAGSWDDGTILAFTPEWDGALGAFRAWYVARSARSGASGSSAGYLTSSDGVTWTRSAQNPVLTSLPGDNVEDSIDSYRDGDRYRIVYGQYDLAARPALRGKGEASVAGAQPAPPAPAPAPPSKPKRETAAFTLLTGGDDGDLERGDASYPPSASSETDGSTSRTRMLLRRSKTPWSYQPVAVSLLRFDTSSLPDGATVEYAELQLHVLERTSSDGRSIVAEWYPADAWPIDSADWTATGADSAHSGTSLASLVPGAGSALVLRNLGAINAWGKTALRLHVSGGAPAGANDVGLAAAESGVRLAPTLVVTYRVG
jgi:hypothetical protein